MEAIFDVIATPLGWLMSFIYKGIPEYLVAIFLFTLLVRLILFPLSLKTQKSQADRARLAPRLERIKKKYEKDPKKLQEKQMALYEKHGVSMTGGCMPMLLQMLVLFGIISVIYSPLKHIKQMPVEVVNASISAAKVEENAGYYKEMKLLNNLEKYEGEVKSAIVKLNEGKTYTAEQADTYIAEMKSIKQDFMFFGKNMLDNPGATPNIMWLIPLLSGLTAFLSSWLSLHYTKQMTAAENQQAQGCSNVMMLIWMPAFSLFITFSVPGGVGVYWICSNLIALLQTFVLNLIYNPAKIRAQAEIEYEERRRQKQEDKKRLAEARAREQRELAQQIKDEQKAPSKKKKTAPAKKEDAPAEVAEEAAAQQQTEQPKDE